MTVAIDTREVRTVHYEGGVKRCAKCAEIKPETEFQQSRSRAGKHYVYLRRASYCRPCHAENARESYRSTGRHRRRVFRVGPNPAHVGLPSQAPTKRQPMALALCVCGALQACHVNSVGSCAATKCPRFFERGL